MKLLNVPRAVALAATLACAGAASGQNPPPVNTITYSFVPYISVPFGGRVGEEVTHYLTCAMQFEHSGPNEQSYNVFGAFEQITVLVDGATAWNVAQYAVYDGDFYVHLNMVPLEWTPEYKQDYTLVGLTIGLGGNVALPNPPGTFDRTTYLVYNAW